MKLFRRLCFLLLVSNLVFGQSTTNNTNSDDNHISKQIKSLEDAIASQQQQIESLRQELAAKKQADSTPHVANAALTTRGNTSIVQETEKPKESPLSFRIGGTDFTPGGFVDFTSVFRSTNTGSVVSTGFGAIPFANSANAHLTEFRATGQYSRINLKVAGKYGANNVTGYIETDFNGNDAANVFVGTNPHTMRLRLYWLDLKRGKWEFLGGQAWGLLTPNRTGVSPLPSDLALTLSEDANIHVGIQHTRQGSFRAAWHPSDHFVWAFAVENAQQFTNGEVTVPTAFATVLSNQLDGGATIGVPNAGPDLATKLAYDITVGGKKYHFEAGGMFTTAKVAVQPTGSAANPFVKHLSVGEGVEGAFNVELIKNFRFLVNGMYGNGIGRYLIGLGPEYVVRPIGVSPTSFDVDTSMVHSGGGTAGFEFQLGSKTQIGTYYGGEYFQRNSFADLTAANTTGAPISCAPGQPLLNKPCIGFGGTNSLNTNNRAIQEGTIDWTQTFWKNPQYGAVTLVMQASYLTRAPWFVPAGAPKNAHLTMGYVGFRYILP
ncbi:MAG TPA: hypothetical protein VGQ12_13195 [Candidatus Angelobacter sp.]|nr:hypothetical protein [Candidatus Angelobacter sp.]